MALYTNNITWANTLAWNITYVLLPAQVASDGTLPQEISYVVSAPFSPSSRAQQCMRLLSGMYRVPAEAFYHKRCNSV